jgi:hypothetical protein
MTNSLTIRGEFAAVELSVDHAGNGPRLCIRDLGSGRERRFSALELEYLVWLSDEALREMVDPSRRWKSGRDRAPLAPDHELCLVEKGAD